ncbi:MAG: cyclic nucleotide-binding domain-containing protein [Deltaproteobacteria bacterium]|nr:cyclic nucleotide-binding domain-containing protein [Deltaproteobacteria bacterium]
MSVVASLKSLPLFQGISEARLGQLVNAFRPASHKAGTTLFVPGDRATHFELLMKGEVTVEESDTAKFVLRPVSPLGELGALTNIPRSTTATAATDIELLSAPVGDLLGFFDSHADIGLAFTKNLLNVVSDKVRRDRRRMGEMRDNIIRTQKAMKQMRETVLAAQETEISKPLFETLDRLIDNNRRANYRVTPTAALSSSIRLDNGSYARVLEVSEGYLKVQGSTKDLTADPSYWAGVLVMPTSEILVSGTVLREDEGSVVIKLDTLVDEFKAQLDHYTTQLQLLDFVV